MARQKKNILKKAFFLAQISFVGTPISSTKVRISMNSKYRWR